MENNNPEKPSEKGKFQTAIEKAAKTVKAFFGEKESLRKEESD
jgi:hypothetical protein